MALFFKYTKYSLYNGVYNGLIIIFSARSIKKTHPSILGVIFLFLQCIMSEKFVDILFRLLFLLYIVV